jgi:hypothetical protein
MGSVFATVEFLLAAAGIVFAVDWYRYPEHGYDKLLAISVAVLALVDILRRQFKDEPEQEGEKKDRKDFEEKIRKALDTLNEAVRKTAQTAQTAQPVPSITPAVKLPHEDPAGKEFSAILNFREQIDTRLKEYAKLRHVDVTGRSSQELLDLVGMNATFKNGIRDYLDRTTDLIHMSVPMREWAVTNGTTFVGVLDMLIKNAKTPAA